MSMTLRAAKSLLKAAIKERKISRIVGDVEKVLAAAKNDVIDALVDDIIVFPKEEQQFGFSTGTWKSTSQVGQVWSLLAIVAFLNGAKTKKAKACRSKITILTLELPGQIDLSLVRNFSKIKKLTCGSSGSQRTVLVNGKQIPTSLRVLNAESCSINGCDTIVSSTLRCLKIGSIIGSLSGIEQWTALEELEIKSISLDESEKAAPIFGVQLQTLHYTGNSFPFPTIQLDKMKHLQSLSLQRYDTDVHIQGLDQLKKVHINGGLSPISIVIQQCVALQKVDLVEMQKDISLTKLPVLQSVHLSSSFDSLALQDLPALNNLSIELKKEIDIEIPVLPSLKKLHLAFVGNSLCLLSQPRLEELQVATFNQCQLELPTCPALKSVSVGERWTYGRASLSIDLKIGEQPVLETLLLASRYCQDISIGSCAALRQISFNSYGTPPSAEQSLNYKYHFTGALPSVELIELIGGQHDFTSWPAFDSLKTLIFRGIANENLQGLNTPSVQKLNLYKCLQLRDVRAIKNSKKLVELNIDSSTPVSPKPSGVSIKGDEIASYLKKLQKEPRKKKAKKKTDTSLLLILKRAVKAKSVTKIAEALVDISNNATPALWDGLSFSNVVIGRRYRRSNIAYYSNHKDLNLHLEGSWNAECYIYVQFPDSSAGYIGFRGKGIFGNYASSYDHQPYALIAFVELLASAPASAIKAQALCAQIEAIEFPLLLNATVPNLSNFINLRSLTISTMVRDISALQKTPQVKTLGVMNARQLENLEDLRGCSLQRLYLAKIERLDNMEAIATLQDLKILEMSVGSSYYLQEAIENHQKTGLKQFTHYSNNVCLNDKLTSLDPLASCSKLEIVSLSGLVGITDISGLSGLDKITSLTLQGFTEITVLPDLDKLDAMSELNLQLLAITNLQNVSNLKSLKSLSIAECYALKDCTGLHTLPALQDITIDKVDAFRSCEGLSNLKSVENIHLRAPGLQTLRGILSLARLKTLTIESDTLTEIGIETPIPSLQSLQINVHTNVESSFDIQHLTAFPNVTTLRLNSWITAGWSVLQELASVEVISMVVKDNSICQPLFLPSLRELSIRYSDGDCGDISWLVGCSSLGSLTFNGNTIGSLLPLAALQHLTSIHINSLHNLGNIDVFRCLSNLKYVAAYGHNITRIRKIVGNNVNVY